MATPAAGDPPGSWPLASVGTIGVGDTPISAAYDGANGEVYVTNLVSRTVSVIDAATEQVVDSILVPSGPWGIAYDSSNGNLYVSESPQSGAQGDVVVIDGATDAIVGHVPVGLGPEAIAFDPDNGYLYVTNYDSSNVSVIDGATNRVVSSLPVGTGPQSVAVDGSTGRLYVANFDSNNVTVIDGATDRTVGMLSAVSTPSAVTVDSENGGVYVTNFDSGDVSIFNGTTDLPVGTVNAGDYPNGVAYDSANALVYVAVEGPSSAPPTNRSSVVAIDGSTNQVVSSVTVGDYPSGMAIDGSNGSVFVADMYADEVSVVPPGAVTYYPVTFQEVGLPTGESWSVRLAGVTNRSVSGSIGFREPNVTGLGYSVGGVSGFAAVPPKGTVDVEGSPDIVRIGFERAYSLWFNETGLPVGTNWSVTVNGTTVNSTTASIAILEPNGSYEYAVGQVPGYLPTPSGGETVIQGGPGYVSISFGRAPGGLRILSFTAVPASFDLGSTTVFTVVTSGEEGTLHYEYQGSPPGCSPPDRSTWNCTPTAAGSSTLKVWVTDSSGANVSANTSIEVRGGTSSPGVASYEGIVIGGGLIAALLVVAGVAVRSRGRGGGPVEEAGPGPDDYHPSGPGFRPFARRPPEDDRQPPGETGPNPEGVLNPDDQSDPLSGFV